MGRAGVGRARCEKSQKSGEHPEANKSQGPLTPQEGGERCLPDKCVCIAARDKETC